MKNTKTILFDFDGTIMNTNEMIIESWQHTFRTVEGKERERDAIIKTFGEPLFITMNKVLPQIPVEHGVEIYREYLKKHFAEKITPFPGMPELIQKLKVLGYQNGLVTSRTRESTFVGLDRFGLLPYFDCVVSCDDTDRHKPDPEPVRIALNMLDAKAERAVMLGDSMFDILCAKNAGVRSVLVGWQLAVSEEELNGPTGPDYRIKAPEDLLNLLAE